MPPTKIRFGTSVPYFGAAIVRLAAEAGLEAGLDPSVPPVEAELYTTSKSILPLICYRAGISHAGRQFYYPARFLEMRFTGNKSFVIIATLCVLTSVCNTITFDIRKRPAKIENKKRTINCEKRGKDGLDLVDPFTCVCHRVKANCW